MTRIGSIWNITLSYKLNRFRPERIGLEGASRGGTEEFLFRHPQSYGESLEVNLFRKAAGAIGYTLQL